MNIKLVIPLMLFLYSGLSLAVPGDFFRGEFNLNIPERSDTPYPALPNYNSSLTQSGSGPAYTVQVSRHHIIPINRLISFYNRVSRNNQLRNLSGFLNTYANNVRFYAQSNGVNCMSLGNDLLDAANLAQAQALGMARPGGQVRPDAFATFQDFYSWLPGNIFIGPNLRSDDPGNGFERNAYIVVGTERFDILSRINRDMDIYINREGNDINLLNSITVNLNTIASRRALYQLNSSNWVLKNGKYSLKTDKQAALTEPDDLVQSSDADICRDLEPTQLAIIMTTVLQ